MSDLNTRMPSGSDVTQRTDEQPAFSADLLELFLQPSNLVSAWKQVRANKGPWRSAKSPGINLALSLDYLKSEGLYSLRDGWVALHYPK